jgi:CHASE3 domain sensor protein
MVKINGRRSLALLLVIPVLLLVQLGLGFTIYENMKRTAQLEVNNTRLDTYLRTNTKYVANGESAQRGYLLTGQQGFYDTYKFDIGEWKKNDDTYDTMPAEVKRGEVAELREISRKKWTEMNSTVDLYNSGLKDSSLNIVKTGYGKQLIDSLRAKSLVLRNKLTAEVSTEHARERQLIYASFGIIAMLIILSVVITWLTYRAFNSYTESLENMVNELEEANAKMMKYNYNSYHSLRTPLRNISGFLTLLSKNTTFTWTMKPENM